MTEEPPGGEYTHPRYNVTVGRLVWSGRSRFHEAEKKDHLSFSLTVSGEGTTLGPAIVFLYYCFNVVAFSRRMGGLPSILFCSHSHQLIVLAREASGLFTESRGSIVSH